MSCQFVDLIKKRDSQGYFECELMDFEFLIVLALDILWTYRAFVRRRKKWRAFYEFIYGFCVSKQIDLECKSINKLSFFASLQWRMWNGPYRKYTSNQRTLAVNNKKAAIVYMRRVRYITDVFVARKYVCSRKKIVSHYK